MPDNSSVNEPGDARFLLYVIAPLCSSVLTAVKRQVAQDICPQGAIVARVYGMKQIGQVYSASRSGVRGGGAGVSVDVGRGMQYRPLATCAERG